MHRHVYIAGAIRGQRTYRYCTYAHCDSMLFYYGTNSRPEVRKDPDVDYYRKMAENANR